MTTHTCGTAMTHRLSAVGLPLTRLYCPSCSPSPVRPYDDRRTRSQAHVTPVLRPDSSGLVGFVQPEFGRVERDRESERWEARIIVSVHPGPVPPVIGVPSQLDKPRGHPAKLADDDPRKIAWRAKVAASNAKRAATRLRGQASIRRAAKRRGAA